MSKGRRRDIHKLTRRVERLENAHRRDLVKLKGEVIRAVRLVVDERKLADVEGIDA